MFIYIYIYILLCRVMRVPTGMYNMGIYAKLTFNKTCCIFCMHFLWIIMNNASYKRMYTDADTHSSISNKYYALLRWEIIYELMMLIITCIRQYAPPIQVTCFELHVYSNMYEVTVCQRMECFCIISRR